LSPPVAKDGFFVLLFLRGGGLFKLLRGAQYYSHF